MKKIFLLNFLILSLLFGTPVLAATAKTTTSKTPAKPKVWQAVAPEGYEAIDWVKIRGIASFAKAPENNGHIDYLTFIYLPYNEIRIVTTNTPKVDFGNAIYPFGEAPAVTTSSNNENNNGFYYDNETDTATTANLEETATTTITTTSVENENLKNWAFTKFQIERIKKLNPDMKFMWNAPFFNMTINPTDLTFALKSEDASSTYISSGARPTNDTNAPRKMLLINNQTNSAQITDFDKDLFISTSTGNQGFEGFAATTKIKGTDYNTERIFLGVKSDGKELVVYCSRGASPEEASAALVTAGVPVENQLQADGGNSATCAYNLTGQYFVEPGRSLPILVGAFPFLYKAEVATDNLNVRDLPSTKGKIVNKLKTKTLLKIYEEKSGWVRISQKQEWVSLAHLKKMAN